MLTIERADLKDAYKITEIKTDAFNKEINTYLGRNGGPPGYDKVESEFYIINQFIAYKIMLDRKLIGAFFLIPLGSEKMRYEDFVISPPFQNLGYGYQTLKLVEENYPLIKEWCLSTPIFSIGNQHLYEKFGYHEISRNSEEIQYSKTTPLFSQMSIHTYN